MPRNLLGMNLAEAKKTDFFVFFHLEETNEGTDAEKRTIVTFKPEGDTFRKLVTVKATIGQQNTIVALELLLARSFVDDNRQGIFARDIAKSLLRSAIPEIDEAGIADLANEIEFEFKVEETQVVINLRPRPKLPEIPTPGYLTYLGKQMLYKAEFSQSEIYLENIKKGDTDELLIVVKLKK